MPIIYRHGLRLTTLCPRCSTRVGGTLKREGPRWALHRDCGHVKTMGWTMPVEELRKRGLVTTETPIDPRAVAAQKQKEEDIERAIKEKTEHEKRKEEFTKGKYL